jgi:hypothetical protein
MQPRPTIETVPTQARVSVKTVSRVINNSTSVTAATRDHVMRVIRQLSFSQLHGRPRGPLAPSQAKAPDLASTGSSLIESTLIIRQSTGRAPGLRAA